MIRINEKEFTRNGRVGCTSGEGARVVRHEGKLQETRTGGMTTRDEVKGKVTEMAENELKERKR